MIPLGTLVSKMADDGFVLLPKVFSAGQIDSMIEGLARANHGQSDDIAVRRRAGNVYGTRNVAAHWPEAAEVWRQPPLPEVLALLMGRKFGLVRTLFFDKPPMRSWTLPWHRDLTIAVRDNSLPTSVFRNPTVKARVPHVEAPRIVLEQMTTLRIHLDEVTEENGPLRVERGSHRRHDDAVPGRGESILAGRGDVLLMRPLLLHSSGHSMPGTVQHRRIVHFEFADSPFLPDGYQWHDFRPGGQSHPRH